MRIGIFFEASGKVRDAFLQRGFDAVSVDLRPTESPGPHIQGDVFDHLDDGWDAAIMHPTCTFLTVSGLHWNKRRPERAAKTEAALEDVRRLMAAPIPRWAIENPVGCISTRIKRPDQTIQPYEFGEDASKRTCLWLKGLPRLRSTGRFAGRLVEWPRGSGRLADSLAVSWNGLAAPVDWLSAGRIRRTAGRTRSPHPKIAGRCVRPPMPASPTPSPISGAMPFGGR